jgi:putative RNA 2'-phosphotransferase
MLPVKKKERYSTNHEYRPELGPPHGVFLSKQDERFSGVGSSQGVQGNVDERRRVRVSKYLSKHLRHQPERLGLTLEKGGWVRVDDLLAACQRHAFALTRQELEEVVENNDKQRFAFDPTGERIRANQGHSVPVDLELVPEAPPALLYHGTGSKSVSAILKTGLKRMARHHVHLSPDVATATRVGARHGRPVVLEIDAASMSQAGFTFGRSQNGVWLVDEVPPAYLSIAQGF